MDFLTEPNERKNLRNTLIANGSNEPMRFIPLLWCYLALNFIELKVKRNEYSHWVHRDFTLNGGEKSGKLNLIFIHVCSMRRIIAEMVTVKICWWLNFHLIPELIWLMRFWISWGKRTELMVEGDVVSTVLSIFYSSYCCHC